ncbi:hypothetical protein JYU34_008516 [Plutella xylostella]|uniref:Uncharacterized protein n=1 Tax=Plutella xylostella TaxID=51655 RepID=A0ABQ7QL45_PLUXY|nr:hypothetical protein JYU34_008516 [Plutella xylostella]
MARWGIRPGSWQLRVPRSMRARCAGSTRRSPSAGREFGRRPNATPEAATPSATGARSRPGLEPWTRGWRARTRCWRGRRAPPPPTHAPTYTSCCSSMTRLSSMRSCSRTLAEPSNQQ